MGVGNDDDDRIFEGARSAPRANSQLALTSGLRYAHNH